MIYLDLRHITITGVKRYTEKLIENNVYDKAIGIKDLGETYGIDTVAVKGNDYSFRYNSHLPLGDKDVLHCPYIYFPFGFKGKAVVTIHDLIPLVVKGNVSLVRRWIYWVKMHYIINHATHIITVSEYTKNDLIKHFRMPENNITVIYNGIDNRITKRNAEDISYIYKKIGVTTCKKIILMIGNRSGHKNMIGGLKAYYDMPNRDEAIVVIVGKKIKMHDEVDEIIKRLGVREQVIELEGVSEKDLEALYNIADVLLFPSFYEGFGFPTLEAMCCGTPVICSNVTALPEVVGNAAYMVDPYDISDISIGLERVLFDKKLQEELIRRGYKRIELFDWKKTALKTCEILKKME